jgi:hypothetical protein
MGLATTLDGTAEYTEAECCDSEGVHLATGDFDSQPTADEGRITIFMPSGTTLNDIDSVSWTVKTTEGYPPHMDLFLDTVDINQSVLTAEISYNNDEGKEWDEGLDGEIGYDECLQTFELEKKDNDFDEINDDTMLWVTKMGAGDDDAPSSTLGEWKAGTGPSSDPQSELLATEIDGNTVVKRIEIEVDNWIATSEAYICNIELVIDGTSYLLLVN